MKPLAAARARWQPARWWTRVGPSCLPFADAASPTLPLSRLLRLALFQVSVGMATVLLVGTLNRVMIVELGMSAGLVAAMVALPLLLAPFRALIGFRSDTHRSVLGWRRVPYLWLGNLLQFGGLAIMPFALIVMAGQASGELDSPAWTGPAGAAIAFLLTGAGLQTVQTAGLALACDLADDRSRPRVVALMYAMLLVGMVASAVVFGLLLADFSPLKLIQVVQGAALATMALNIVALWKQEPRRAALPADEARPSLRAHWQRLAAHTRATRFLVAVGLGTAAFSMQDVILEPYGGEILELGVGATTRLTALMAGGALAAFAYAARRLQRGGDPCRYAAFGALVGIVGFSAVIFAEPLSSIVLFCIGVAAIGFGSGAYAVGTLTAAMDLERAAAGDAARAGLPSLAGLVLGAWGAVQATCGGLAVAVGGELRDIVSNLAVHGALGEALMRAATGYSVVYHVELLLLFLALAALGPLVRPARAGPVPPAAPSFGLAQFPG